MSIGYKSSVLQNTIKHRKKSRKNALAENTDQCNKCFRGKLQMLTIRNNKNNNKRDKNIVIRPGPSSAVN